MPGPSYVSAAKLGSLCAVVCAGLACGRTPLGHAPSDAGARRGSGGQTSADAGLPDFGVAPPSVDGGRFATDHPVPNCQMNQMHTLPFEDLPLDRVAGLHRSPDGFWIFGNQKTKDAQDQALFGELRPNGFISHLTLPRGTFPNCHAVGAQGRHWLAGSAPGELSRDATSVVASAGRTGFLLELDIKAKTVEAAPIKGEPEACVADPRGGVVLAGTALYDGRDGPYNMLWARYAADHQADWAS